MITTPLRYPGGKSKAIKKLYPLIPEFSEFREPFIGGASMFIFLKQQFPDRYYWINDLNNDLYHLWDSLKNDTESLIKEIQNIKDITSDGKSLFKKLISETPSYGLEKAIRFFVLNRISFSGTVDSGGYSQSAFNGRFTQSSIDRLKSTATLLIDTKITNFDYESVINHDGDNVFLFLDPPYLSATKSKLYGKKGVLHTNFDHNRFANIMQNNSHKWMITYDDCPEIRKLFSFANIVNWQMQYGMNNINKSTATKGNELIITNYNR